MTFILLAGFGCGHSHDHEGHSHDHSGDGHSHGGDEHGHSHSFTFLSMNGEFHLNPGDSMSQEDPRNPGRLELTTTEEAGTLTRIAFYDHDDLNQLLGECGYQFIGSRPDPHYYPHESKTSIWDVFEKVSDFSGDCSQFKYVLSRSPHGDPIHMHLRYGNDLEEVLAMSNDDPDMSFNPWWATYCDIDRTTACD